MADLVLTDQSFQKEVLEEKSMPVLVDFWATWCQPCKIVSPIIDDLAKEYEGKLKVGKMDVDENPETAGNYNVMSIPTIMIFKNGQPVKSIIGAQSKDNFKRAIDEALA